MSQAVTKPVAIVLQFTIAALSALNGDEQGRCVAEVVVHHDGQNARRQLRLKTVQSVFDFRPHLVLVVHVVVQFDHRDTHVVLRRSGGLRTLHLAKGKEIALQRTSHLLFYLLTSGTGIDGHNHTLTYSGMRKFVFRHDVHAVDSHYKQNADDEQRYRVVI